VFHSLVALQEAIMSAGGDAEITRAVLIAGSGATRT
jgi:hypothetical protein